MPTHPVSFDTPSPNLTKDSVLVGITDRIYDLARSPIIIREILVRGDLSGVLEYNGAHVRIVSAEAIIGLLVDERGMRGPVWQNVICEVVGG